MMHHAAKSWILGSLVACLSFCTAVAGEDPASRLAKDILDSTEVQGGIVVHLGCGDGELTAALRADDRFTVHGLEADPDQVAEAQRYIQSAGVYGPVSIEQFLGAELPYTENLINLVVVQEAGQVPMDEVMRVLCPNGVAYVQQNGRWAKRVKPWPDNIDEWGHFLHDATGNAVADDSVVGPPRSLQWIAPPL